MKMKKYTITFVSGKIETVYAFRETEARILAQAEQIKLGNVYTIEAVIREI